MRIVAIEHVQLAMPAGREDDARRFYSGLLGLPEAPKPPDLAARGGAWFEAGKLKIHLGVDPDFRAARKAHPALLVEGLAELVDALRDGGWAVVDDEPLEGYDRVYVFDPFGNRIELMEPTGPGDPARADGQRAAGDEPGRSAAAVAPSSGANRRRGGTTRG